MKASHNHPGSLTDIFRLGNEPSTGSAAAPRNLVIDDLSDLQGAYSGTRYSSCISDYAACPAALTADA